MSSFLFELLPDEIILKVFSTLDYISLIHCGQLSKRIRKISHDDSLWESMKIYDKTVPTGFVQFVLEKGCKYLSFYNVIIVKGVSLGSMIHKKNVKPVEIIAKIKNFGGQQMAKNATSSYQN